MTKDNRLGGLNNRHLLSLFGGDYCSVSLSYVSLFVTPWPASLQASLFLTISQSLHKFTSTESVMPSNHLIICCPLLPVASVFPSIRVFSNELAFPKFKFLCLPLNLWSFPPSFLSAPFLSSFLASSIRWPMYWSFSFSISPSNEYLGLISFRIN